MKKTLLTLALSAASCFFTNAQEASKADLVFVAEFPSFETWRDKAFMPDADRRSAYCNEEMTAYGKVNNQMALIYINQFDMARMGEFAADKTMEELMKANKISHSEVYQVIEMNPENAPAKAHLFFMISFNDYDGWANEAFLPDSARRAQFCDESRTKMAKVDDTHAMVILYDFDLSKTWEFESNEEIGKLMQKYGVRHEVSLLNKL
ncbi:MAG: hypothetical protein RLZZ242_226 [Bacteroidota bacterium]|jgi:hypothetical protein